MPGATTFALFALAALVVLAIPGPAVLYIVTRSVDEGRASGLASVLGVHVGTVVHVVAAAAGLSALLASSSVAFTAVKLAGAAYLVVLGVRRIAGRGRGDEDRPAPAARLRRVVGHGALVNILNPKTALFFLAFVPQFVDPARGRVGLQVLALGATYIGLGLVTDGAWALTAAAAGAWLRGRVARSRAQRYISGGVFITLGTAAALSGTPHRG